MRPTALNLSKKLYLVGLGVTIALSLTACGYDGWVRYPCQEYENWNKPECKRPQCEITGTCTDDLIGKDVAN